ncbi:MAG TPA: hypothetical protein VGF16_16630 [Bryobacteraceae bacterium]|jgi:hypothetical protein
MPTGRKRERRVLARLCARTGVPGARTSSAAGVVGAVALAAAVTGGVGGDNAGRFTTSPEGPVVTRREEEAVKD